MPKPATGRFPGHINDPLVNASSACRDRLRIIAGRVWRNSVEEKAPYANPVTVDGSRAAPFPAFRSSCPPRLLHDAAITAATLTTAGSWARSVSSGSSAKHLLLHLLAALTTRHPLNQEAGEGLTRAWHHSRSTLRSPRVGVHHSTTSIVACSLRWVCTTSAMSARKRSPSAPSVTGPGGDHATGDLRFARPLSLGPSTGSIVARAGRTADPVVDQRPCARSASTKHQLTILERRLDPGDPR